MGTERRQQILLGALLLVLAIVAYRVWARTSVEPASSSNAKAAAPRSAHAAPPAVTAPDVHLRELEDEKPKPASGERNLFRFRPKAPPPPPPRAVGPEQSVNPTPAPTGPPPPPPPAPIALKFIGILESSGQPEKIAILSDGRSVFHGREGDIIEGRYRIVRIGVESIEMAHLDGRGRQTIRLSGS